MHRKSRFGLFARLARARFAACHRGSTAVEFALVFPALAALIVGGLYTALLMYSAAGLHHASRERIDIVDGDVTPPARSHPGLARRAGKLHQSSDRSLANT